MTLFQPDGLDREPDPGDDLPPAAWAVGVLAFVTGDVADVDEAQALVEGHASRGLERGDGGRRQVLDEIHRLEPGEMDGDALAGLVPDPAAHVPDGVHP